MNNLRASLLVLSFAAAFCLPGRADVEQLESTSYLISGTWTFWPEKDLLAPTGNTNLGDFKAILFKPRVNDYEGVREMKQTPATFKVRGRESTTGSGDRILIVEEILEKVE